MRAGSGPGFCCLLAAAAFGLRCCEVYVDGVCGGVFSVFMVFIAEGAHGVLWCR